MIDRYVDRIDSCLIRMIKIKEGCLLLDGDVAKGLVASLDSSKSIMTPVLKTLYEMKERGEPLTTTVEAVFEKKIKHLEDALLEAEAALMEM